jgi:hypothetical protein
MTTRTWNTAVGTGLLRLVVGAVLLRFRHPLARRLAGAPADDRLMPLMFGYFGLRDITVGVVTLAATRPGGNVRKAVQLQGLADATDAGIVALAGASGRLSRPRTVAAGAVAVGSAAGEFLTAARLPED